MANEVNYRDPTANNFPNDYDDSKVDSRVKLRSESIKHKQMGVDTREAIYQGLEIGAATAGEAKDIANDTASRQDAVDQSQSDFEDRYNDQIAGNTDLDEVIDARDDGDLNFSTLRERLNQTLKIDDNIDFGDKRSLFDPEISRIKKLINKDNLNLLFITDLHWEQDNLNAYQHSSLSISHLNNALAFDDVMDAIILGGDNTNSYSKSLAYIKKQIEQVNDKFYDTGNSDKFSLLGNHDDGSMRSILLDRSLTRTDIVRSTDFIELMRAKKPNYGEVRMPDNLAFYKDYLDKKIRVIGLNGLDIPDALTNDDDSIKYNRQHKFAYSEAQLKWLSEEALMGVPSDYQTIVFSHIHTNPAPVADSSTESVDTRYNYDLLQQLLWAFQAGNSVVLNNELTDFKVNFTVDFSDQGKRTLIGFVNGHTHSEAIVEVGTFKDIHCLNSIYEGSGNELVNQGAGKPNRKLDDVTEDAFTIISINSTNKHVDLIGFGAATNRGFDYD